jgi:hypothetical protein
MATYNVWQTRADGGHIVNPTRIYAGSLPDAQRKAAAILVELQEKGMLTDYSIETVTDCCAP